MKRFAIAAAATALTATAALAQVPYSTIDTDGDKMLSFDELSAVYPDFTSTEMEEIDSNGDQLIDPIEANSPAATEAFSQMSATTTGMMIDVDLEGNQAFYYTFEELSSRYPDLSSDDFQQIDADEDGFVDAIEFRAPNAQEMLK